MNKKLLVAVGILLVLLFAGSVWFNIKREPGNQTYTATIPPNAGEVVTKRGVVACLEPAKTTGPHIQSCAIGLKQDNGTYYALQDKTGGTLPTAAMAGNMPIEVTGTLTAGPTDYRTDGTIQFSSFRSL